MTIIYSTVMHFLLDFDDSIFTDKRQLRCLDALACKEDRMLGEMLGKNLVGVLDLNVFLYIFCCINPQIPI